MEEPKNNEFFKKIFNDILINFYPLSYLNGAKITPYFASYSSIIGSSSVVDISYSDMYRYMEGKVKDKTGNNVVVPEKLKTNFKNLILQKRLIHLL